MAKWFYIKKSIPVKLKVLKLAKTAAFVLPKPNLDYIEMHLTDHCILNCMGCGHFSPIADTWYADIDDHEKDMQRLSALFSNIKTIRLMGGEPLLHPNVEDFLIKTRKYFPKSSISVVTNGILFFQMRDHFWETCIEYKILIDWTIYPPFESKINEITEYIKGKEVDFKIIKTSKFHANINVIGNSDKKKSFYFCRTQYFCPFLRNGMVYLCARQALLHYFNKKFNTKIPQEGYFDLQDKSLNGWDLLYSINKESDTCRYCNPEFRRFDWAKSNQNMTEWEV